MDTTGSKCIDRFSSEKELRTLLYKMFMKGCWLGQGYNQKTLDEAFEVYYYSLVTGEKK